MQQDSGIPVTGKTLKFAPDLVPMVLSGEKNTTWRLWDEKGLTEGDTVTFIRRPELTPFAVAKIVSCKEKTLGQLTSEDKKGHESYASEDEMYERYMQMYKKPVDSETPLKIIKFELIKIM